MKHTKFQEFSLRGRGRDHLKLVYREIVIKDIYELYYPMFEKLNQHLSAEDSPISITFDMWTDRSARGYLGTTGQFFDYRVLHYMTV